MATYLKNGKPVNWTESTFISILVKTERLSRESRWPLTTLMTPEHYNYKLRLKDHNMLIKTKWKKSFKSLKIGRNFLNRIKDVSWLKCLGSPTRSNRVWKNTGGKYKELISPSFPLSYHTVTVSFPLGLNSPGCNLNRIVLVDNPTITNQLTPHHHELTRERNIRFLLFEIKRVFVYNSRVFKLTDLFMLYSFIQNVYADKKY